MKKLNLSRRGFIEKAAAFGLGSLFLPKKAFSANPGQKLPETLEDRKILVVWGGWDGHQPKQCVDIIEPWLRSLGADVLYCEDDVGHKLSRTCFSSLESFYKLNFS